MRRRESLLPQACLCPHCGALLTAATALEDEDDRPEPGDYSLCLHCGVILIYTPDMKARRAGLEDLAKLPRDTLLLLMRAQQAQELAIASRPPQETEREN